MRPFRDVQEITSTSTFSGLGGDIELAIEIALDETIRETLENRFDLIRYEMRFGLHEESGEHAIKEERVIYVFHVLIHDLTSAETQTRIYFPELKRTKFLKKLPIKNIPADREPVIRGAKQESFGNDTYYVETKRTNIRKGWLPSFKLGMKRSALANSRYEPRFPHQPG
ncbi:MAG: hypothetical protein R2751_17865 [Bacteroidales bacterium]